MRQIVHLIWGKMTKAQFYAQKVHILVTRIFYYVCERFDRVSIEITHSGGAMSSQTSFLLALNASFTSPWMHS